uniref:Uncharacterized protein n=1 Tax=Rhipicephalus appendiculatus TaxID=34631 RepID=A0A131YEZ0_RHIAP
MQGQGATKQPDPSTGCILWQEKFAGQRTGQRLGVTTEGGVHGGVVARDTGTHMQSISKQPLTSVGASGAHCLPDGHRAGHIDGTHVQPDIGQPSSSDGVLGSHFLSIGHSGLHVMHRHDGM